MFTTFVSTPVFVFFVFVPHSGPFIRNAEKDKSLKLSSPNPRTMETKTAVFHTAFHSLSLYSLPVLFFS